ncbi:retinol-binding protein [Anopheles darlingi]|uniref:Retinol-binding protein n=1 Tax=Anopheles darlingi TaxID=43151 RepID=W5JA58_ANODA|nr:retinol-binding protein [Anopheles darlingi]
MPWERPASVPYPNVWWTFEAPDPDREDSGLATYRVEDLTEDRFDDVMKLYTEHFLDDEPLCAHSGIRQDAEAYEETRTFWKHAFTERLTVVCYKEGSKELVGANILAMSLANDKVDFMKLVKNEKLRKLIGINEYMSEAVNLYELYGVDKYLTAYGLTVNKRVPWSRDSYGNPQSPRTNLPCLRSKTHKHKLYGDWVADTGGKGWIQDRSRNAVQ